MRPYQMREQQILRVYRALDYRCQQLHIHLRSGPPPPGSGLPPHTRHRLLGGLQFRRKLIDGGDVEEVG